MTQKEKILVGCVYSNFQLTNYIAYMLKAESKIKFDKKVLYVKYYWGNDSLNEKYLRTLDALNVEYVITTNKFSLENYCSKNACNGDEIIYVGNNVDVFSCSYMLFRKKRYSVSYILIDDGVGSYSNFLHLYRVSLNERNALKMLVLFPLNYFAKTVVEKLIKAQRFGMLDVVTLDLNNEYIDYYLETLSLTAEEKKMTLDKNLLIFCTQPYIDLGGMTETEYSFVLNEVNKYSELNELDMLIIKHPADKKFDYSYYRVSEYSGSFEEFAYLYKDIDLI